MSVIYDIYDNQTQLTQLKTSITPDHESKSIIVDIDFETERATKMRLAHAYQRLFNHKDGMEAIVSADEKVRLFI